MSLSKIVQESLEKFNEFDFESIWDDKGARELDNLFISSQISLLEETLKWVKENDIEVDNFNNTHDKIITYLTTELELIKKMV